MFPPSSLLTPARSRRGSTMPIVLLVIVGLLAAVGTAAFLMLGGEDDPAKGPLTEKVVRKDFINEVVEAGEVESSENVEIRSEVKSRNGAGTTIIWVKPEGSIVKGPYKNEQGEQVPGDLLVELDSSGLALELQQEEIILNNKKAARDQAQNLLLAARSALREYVGVTEYQTYFPNQPVWSPSDASASQGTTAAGVTDLVESVTDAADGQPLLASGESELTFLGERDDGSRGTYHVDEKLLLAERFVAEENKRRAEQYYRYSLNLAQKGYVTQRQLASDHFALMKAVQDLEAANIKLSVLQQHTKNKMISQLLSDINNAEAVYLAEENSVKVQLDRVVEITSQIEKCKILAPQDGVVVYANVRDRRGGTDFLVEAGATIRERQVIIRLPDSQRMQVKAKVSESKISMLDSNKPLKAIVTIDAFEGMDLEGVVTKVNDYPEPTSWFSSTVKEYVAYIKIVDPPPSLKTGLTAKVRIRAQEIPDALQVPIQSVHRHHGRYYCFVKGPLGWKAQLIKLGPSNERSVVIEDGLTEGQVVALDPANLLTEVDLPDAPSPGGKSRPNGATNDGVHAAPPPNGQKAPN